MDAIADPTAFAALIAPTVDRLAIAIYTATPRDQVAALRGDHAFSPGSLALVSGAVATGRLSRTHLDGLTRYQHFGPPQEFVDGLVARGAVIVDDGGDLATTPAALEVARALVGIQVAAAETLWAPRAAQVPRLAELTARCVTAAAEESPLAALTAAGWTPPGPAARLWTNLLALRLHRADSHAAAWTAAGRTAAEMRALGPGPERDAIEVETNRLAASPWAVLSPTERVELLGGLAGLSGVGAGI